MVMENKKIKVIFMGSAEFSVPILIELIKKFNVLAVITEIDKPSGRGKDIIPPPTKVLAKQHHIPCWQPLTLKKNPRFADEVAALSPDIIVVAAYGKFLPPDFLEIPLHGCLNVHPSLLPKYRGASPIQAALLAGEKSTGVTVILMDPGMDSGDIVAQEPMKIEPEYDYRQLARRLALLGADMLVKYLPKYIEGQISLTTQDDKAATFCGKISKENGYLDWAKSARQLHNQIRAFSEWPGSYAFFNKKKIDIIEAMDVEVKPTLMALGQIFEHNKKILVCCGEGCLELVKVKLEGKKETPIINFINGHQDFVGATLS